MELCQKQKGPAWPKLGGQGGKGRMLLVDSVSPLSALGLEGLDGVPGLLHRTGHEPADGVLLPAHLVHDLLECGAVLPLEHGAHLRRLPPPTRPAPPLPLAALPPFAHFLRRSRLPC